MSETVLLLPGLGNSGPDHWQSLWEANDRRFTRVQQHDWDTPNLETWTARLDAAIVAAPGAFLVAHSFGCLAAMRRLSARSADVAGALLVAPADPARLGLDPFPLSEIAIPLILVASLNDPWLAFGKARHMARALGARFVSAGEAGHINAQSGHGTWREGERLLARLAAAARARERELIVAMALSS